MLRTRVIPALLLKDGILVKTVKFAEPVYIGDPVNTVRIFNELEVDELIVLDITASRERRGPNHSVLREIADECFMPLAYGGGISSVDDAKSVVDIGFEKIAVNSHAVKRPELITELASHFGSQAVIVSIDVKRDLVRRRRVWTYSGRRKSSYDPIEWALECTRLGAGELLLTSIEREGTWKGFDGDLVCAVSRHVSIPVIAHGGASSLADIREVVREGGAAAVALGSMVVFQGEGHGVLVNFPDANALARALTW